MLSIKCTVDYTHFVLEYVFDCMQTTESQKPPNNRNTISAGCTIQMENIPSEADVSQLMTGVECALTKFLWPAEGFQNESWPERFSAAFPVDDKHGLYLLFSRYCQGVRWCAEELPTVVEQKFEYWMLDWRSDDTFMNSLQVKNYIDQMQGVAVSTCMYEFLNMQAGYKLNNTDLPWSDTEQRASEMLKDIYYSDANPVLHALYVHFKLDTCDEFIEYQANFIIEVVDVLGSHATVWGIHSIDCTSAITDC